MNTSPRVLREFLKASTASAEGFTLPPLASLPAPSSSGWKRRFSSKKIEPGAGSLQAASTSAPTQSARKVTGLDKSRSSSSATTFNELLGSGSPSGLPKWLIRTNDRAPEARMRLIVGRVDVILVKSEILPFLRGTLKSALIKTLWSLSSSVTEVIWSLLANIFMAEVKWK